MSFLSEIKKQKSKLKETDTVVTRVDGQRFIENTNVPLPNNFGFVVDTKPDHTPALISDHVYIGSQDCATSPIIEAYNIRHLLSLGIDVQTNVNRKFVECLDLPETDIKPVLSASLPFIATAVRGNENVLIHCNAGVSRTSMVAMAYLMQFQDMEFDDAYRFVKARRPAVRPNDGFMRQLRNMKPGTIL